jgi:DNA-binding GntR family transcriptional regulator
MIGGGPSRAEKRFAAAVNLAADKLRAAIIACRFAPGERLLEDTLTGELKAGPVIVREALRTLEEEGYVTLGADNDAAVSKPTRGEIENYYDIAGVLEGLAARLAVARAQPEEIERLRELHQLLKDAGQKRDVDRYFAVNASFHRFIAQLARSRRLDRMVDGLRREIQKTRVLALRATERLDYSMREHDQILDAFLKKNPELAESTMVRHMNNHKESLLRTFEDAKGDGDEQSNGKKSPRAGH